MEKAVTQWFVFCPIWQLWAFVILLFIGTVYTTYRWFIDAKQKR